jgi:hypothetical protein
MLGVHSAAFQMHVPPVFPSDLTTSHSAPDRNGAATNNPTSLVIESVNKGSVQNTTLKYPSTANTQCSCEHSQSDAEAVCVLCHNNRRGLC